MMLFLFSTAPESNGKTSPPFSKTLVQNPLNLENVWNFFCFTFPGDTTRLGQSSKPVVWMGAAVGPVFRCCYHGEKRNQRGWPPWDCPSHWGGCLGWDLKTIFFFYLTIKIFAEHERLKRTSCSSIYQNGVFHPSIMSKNDKCVKATICSMLADRSE